MSRIPALMFVVALVALAGDPGVAMAGKPKHDPGDQSSPDLVFPKTSQEAAPAPLNIEVCLDDLAGQVVANLRSKSKTKIAVVEFSDLDGNVSALGQFIAEELITRLYRTNSFEVVERNLLSKVMAEHALSLSGLVDGTSAQKLGRILGVEAIATGSITDLGTTLKLNARLISTETGTIFAVASTSLPKDSSVTTLLSRAAASRGPAPATVGQADRTPAAPEPVLEMASGLLGEYYNLPANTTVLPVGEPIFTRSDGTISFDWGSGSPVPRVKYDWFGARWTGYIKIEKPGLYSLRAVHDDGLRIWIDGQKVYDRWAPAPWNSVDVRFDKAGWLPFRAEYLEVTDPAYCRIMWSKPGAADFEPIDSGDLQHEAAALR